MSGATPVSAFRTSIAQNVPALHSDCLPIYDVIASRLCSLRETQIAEVQTEVPPTEVRALCLRRNSGDPSEIFSTMIDTKLRGSRAYVPKPGHFVLNKIKDEHTSLRSLSRTQDWLDELPAAELKRTSAKRKALHELQNNACARRRLTTTRTMATRSTPAIQSKKKGRRNAGGVGGEKDDVVEASLRRSARSTNKRDETENNEGLVLEQSSVHHPKLSTAPVLTSAGSASAFSHQSQSQAPSSPSKGFVRSRSSSPLKGITAERLSLYTPRITFTDYVEQAKRPHLLTEPIRTLWKDFIRPCGEDSSSIPIELKGKRSISREKHTD